MALSGHARSGYASRNSGTALCRKNCRNLVSATDATHARWLVTADIHSPQSLAHISPTPQRVYRAAAVPVTAPPAESSLLYVRIGICLLCFCASVFCISLVFLVRRLLSTVKKLNTAIDTLNEELPGVAASFRLTSLEMADCILEFAGLGRDVSGGIRAGGRALKATEASLQDSGAALKNVWDSYIKPGISERIKASKEIWDHTLHANADMDRDPTPAEVAAVTRMSIAELRQSLAAITALHQVVVQGVRVMSAVQQRSEPNSPSDGAVLQGETRRDDGTDAASAVRSESLNPEAGPADLDQAAGSMRSPDGASLSSQKPSSEGISPGRSSQRQSTDPDHTPPNELPC